MSQNNPKAVFHNVHTQFNYLTLPVTLFKGKNRVKNERARAKQTPPPTLAGLGYN